MKNLYLMLIAALVIVSCSDTDSLNPVNQTRISDATAFATPQRVGQLVLGMYSGVKVGNFYGGRFLNYQDVRGPEFNNERNNGVTNLFTWNFGVQSSTNEVQNFWSAAYTAINRCNVVIGGLETSPITPELKTTFTAEARFLRALSYYSLLTLYAKPYTQDNGASLGVPLRLVAETSGGNNDLVRSSVADVYKQVIDDLNFAELNLPLTNTTAFNNTTRAHRNTAIALKTRVYLSMGKYPEVITEANKIVSSTAPFTATSGVSNAMVPTIQAAFASAAVTVENVFSFPYGPNDLQGTQNGLVHYYNASSVGGSEYSLAPTSITANTGWKTSDSRRNFNVVLLGKTWLHKWTKSQSDPDFVPVIRYSEILLNLSEALTRSSNSLDARAIQLLNAVRGRSDATTVFTSASFTNVQALLDQIAIERRIELLGEGFSSPDIMRLKQNFPAKGLAPSVSTTDTQYLWPIPLNELLYNKLAVQNPGH
ncbi:SusD family protein [Flavobacterium omnivorum]|uniref:SusD family protein n=1 Tax=Flavobacterium omnivorum TaxID=178355 RepID=A0A1G8C8N6_9FLAO|nr:RagB/SusD family nutrient uptake outer membrane protein [Flavobacterium omnivorum]SDH41897.1 SusD family protein [Flavobacterium omnivorum]